MGKDRLSLRVHNPHADFGGIVTGSRFIGREAELRKVKDRILNSAGFGSISVVGLPRIGKSSLVCEALRRAPSEVLGQRVVVAQANVGTFKSVGDLLRYVVEELAEELRSKKLGNELTHSRVNKALTESLIDFNVVRTVFRSLKQEGLRPISVLDEFDAGRRLFKDTPNLFHWLRELCSNSDFKAAVVFVAKRRLQDISRLAGYESSYWTNVLMSLPLKPFSNDDTDIFFSKLERDGVPIKEKERQEILSFLGCHPYLLDMFGYHVWARVKQREHVDINWIGEICDELIREYHQQIDEVLEDSAMLSKLIQIVVGPQWDVTKDDVDVLCELGVLRNEDGRLLGFSRAFENHLQIVSRSVDVWPLWRETERSLRAFLEDRLKIRFGLEWPKELSQFQPKLGRIIEEFQKRQDKDKKLCSFPKEVPSLLAYSYPSQIFEIMAADWTSLGEPVLGKDKNGWGVKFATLSKVRTPLAHNREESVGDGERKQTEGICQEILKLYSGYQR